MKKLICIIIAASLFSASAFAAPAPPEIVAPCGVLMEKETGEILYQKNAHTAMAPASVTKVMTLLLVMEALDAGKISMDDMVTVSPNAASMGGSQVYLEPGEQMSMDDMLKATVIASGNDAATALAEHVAGSAEGFVSLMNERAKELGMNDTVFKNCTGLDVDGHVTSAYDIALMSRALIAHDEIKKYTTVWMDSLRNGAFQLANTNKLIRSYNGITGLKTGFTSTAKYCLSATAERDGMELIAAVMGVPTSPERFASAASLLDYGFANYTLYDSTKNITIEPMRVLSGKQTSVPAKLDGSKNLLIEKTEASKIECTVIMPDDVKAPVEKGQKLGEIKVTNGDKELTSIPIVAEESVDKLTVTDIFWKLFSQFAMR